MHQNYGEFLQPRQNEALTWGVLVPGPEFARFFDERLDILGKASTRYRDFGTCQYGVSQSCGSPGLVSLSVACLDIHMLMTIENHQEKTCRKEELCCISREVFDFRAVYVDLFFQLYG